MAILQGVETRIMDDYRFSAAPMWSVSMLSGEGDFIPVEIPRIEKIVFKFKMSLVRDPYEHRRITQENESDWFRHHMSNHLELEDPSGKLFSLDEIYLDKHHLPTHLRQDERVVYHTDYLLHYLQDRRFNLYVNLGDPSSPRGKRMKLINPIITRLDKTEERFPGTLYGGINPNSWGADRRFILDFEILCDSYQEVPMYNAATIQQVIKETLKKNISIRIEPTRQEMLTIQATVAEMKARETLRDMLSEREWRKYLTNGFVMVQGVSGKFYQVFNKQKHLRVYDKGKFIKELCIHTSAKECPPTDHVLNIKIMIECDEQSVWSNSNLYEPTKKSTQVIQTETGNLIELFGKLKTDRQFVNNRLEQRRQRYEDEFFREYA